MKRTVKILLSVLIVCAVLAAAGLGAYRHRNLLFDLEGWHTDEAGGRYYLDEWGLPVTGWHTLEGNTYYFDPDRGGALATLWQELEGQTHYLGAQGIVQPGWMAEENRLYYLDALGTPLTGWAQIAGDQYYFDPSGQMQTGWLDTEAGRYYLAEDGIMVTGWLDTEAGCYYLAEDGTMVTGWLDADDGRYYLSPEGLKQTGWLALDSTTYYLDPQGRLYQGWLEESGSRYYITSSGTPATGWLDMEGSRYYLGDDGAMHTGFLELEEALYYFRENGAMAVGQVTLENRNYFFTSQGKYVLLVNGSNPLPQDYTPELVSFKGHRIHASILDDFTKLLADCKAAGYSYYITSSYRTLADQQDEWDGFYQRYLDETGSPSRAYQLTARHVAKPGYSEHHTSLAIDVAGSDAMYAWMAENCWKYGFIIRYPEDATQFTGYRYEPWHLRYVGYELAEELFRLDVCLEEYFASLTQSQ